MTLYLGVDPGSNSGGICALNSNGAIEFLEAWASTSHFADLVRTWSDHLHVILEKAQPMSKGGQAQGVKGVFSYAQHFGEIQGVLIALKVPFSLVPPVTWQRTMYLGTAAGKPSKERALTAAKRLFPSQDWLASPRCKKPHLGLVDSALIASYGLRVLNGQVAGKKDALEEILEEGP